MKVCYHMITVLTVATAIGVSAAERPTESPNSELKPVEEFIAAKLDSVDELTVAQREKIRNLMHERLPAIHSLVRRFIAEQRALHDVARVENVDESAIRAQATKFGNVLGELAVHRSRLVRELHDTFSKEQIDRLREKQQDLRAGIESFLDEVGKRLAGE